MHHHLRSQIVYNPNVHILAQQSPDLVSFHVEGIKKPPKRRSSSRAPKRNFPRRENTTTSVPLPSQNGGVVFNCPSFNCSPNFKGNMINSGKNTSVKKT